MKRLVIFLFAAAWLLPACSLNLGEPALRATARTEGTRVLFSLQGYQGTESPTITVIGADGRDWSKITHVEMTPDGPEARLDLSAHAHILAEQLDFVWRTPDGREAPGQTIYQTGITLENLQATLTEGLVIYHTGTVSEEMAREWQGALERVMEWTGLQPRSKRIPLHVYPDWAALLKVAKFDEHSVDAPLAFASGGRVFLPHDLDRDDAQAVLVHELSHALGIGYRPLWIGEGFSTYLELRERQRLAAAGSASQTEYLNRWRRILQDLVKESRATAYELADADYGGDQSPYSIGYSVALFTRSRYGDAGIRQMLKRYVKLTGSAQPMEDLFGLPLPEIEAEWRKYLASGLALDHHDSLR